MSGTFSKQKVGQRVYEEALAICSRVAMEEFRVAQTTFHGAKLIVGNIHKRIEEILEHAKKTGVSGDEARERLQQLTAKLQLAIETLLVATEQSLGQKRVHPEKFTVTLFGRTLAGKSTIREAMTKGDGRTIGKGAVS